MNLECYGKAESVFSRILTDFSATESYPGHKAAGGGQLTGKIR